MPITKYGFSKRMMRSVDTDDGGGTQRQTFACVGSIGSGSESSALDARMLVKDASDGSIDVRSVGHCAIAVPPPNERVPSGIRDWCSRTNSLRVPVAAGTVHSRVT